MYYPLYAFLYLLSLLPTRVLYILSDLLCFLVYNVFAYRKAVVISNIAQVFPGKNKEEILAITKKFYKNFIDSFIETIKLISASEAYINKHVEIDVEAIESVFSAGKKCQLLSSHSFNWEYCNVGLPLHMSHPFLGVYMPLKNKPMDRLFLKIRSRTGSVLLPATNMQKAILPYRNQIYALGLIADQNPGDPKKAYWLYFFGKPTPFVMAPERGARLGNIPCVFCNISRLPKRGYYRLKAEMISENPAELPEGEITRKFVKIVEDAIRKQPDNYLWSHKRWKHSWNESYKRYWIDGERPMPENEVSPLSIEN